MDEIDGYANLDVGLPYEQKTGIKQLWELVEPVWKLTPEELADYMIKQVIYETDDLVAFNKPFQMAYASGPKDQAQFDRIIKLLKNRFYPEIDGLFIISKLEKYCSGVTLFGKTKKKQEEFLDLIKRDHMRYHFRCLCKNNTIENKTRISIPLIKVLRKGNYKLCPLIGNASHTQELFHLSTDIDVVNENRLAKVSLIDAFISRAMPHLVRSHLYYGLNCPLVGDSKYTKASLPEKDELPTKLSPDAMAALQIGKNHIRKLPMFMHLAEVHIPEGKSRATVIKADLPRFFMHALKKLSLLRK